MRENVITEVTLKTTSVLLRRIMWRLHIYSGAYTCIVPRMLAAITDWRKLSSAYRALSAVQPVTMTSVMQSVLCNLRETTFASWKRLADHRGTMESQVDNSKSWRQWD